MGCDVKTLPMIGVVPALIIHLGGAGEYVYTTV
jgi:hypothetical protein